jgi:hypothetical protein
MSDRRINTDDPGDPRVSAAYREIADERTPAHLDHGILNAARAAARPRWNNAVAWLRPAAWAATVGVCLAIVVEISLLPRQDPAAVDSVTQEPAPAPLPAAGAKRLDESRPRAGEARELRRPKELQQTPVADPAGLSDSPATSADSAARSVEKVGDRTGRPTFGDAKPTAAVPVAAPASNLVTETATERYCDESDTGDPNTWLECILRLEREGLYEAARLERELLADVFPPPELP